MRIIESVATSLIQQHLKDQASGVLLDLDSMLGIPGPAERYKGFKVILDADDASKLVLYWQFQEHTRGSSCRLTDLLESAESLERVRRFLEGDPTKGYSSADLRTLPHLSPTIVTNDIAGTFLYVIDGNHRTIAQHLSQKGFQDVPAFVCQHPGMLKWAYIPTFYKKVRSIGS